jgi:hypothetical protein
MNDRQRIRLAEAIQTRTALLAQVLNTVVDGTTVMGRMRDMQGGLRAKSFDGSGGSMRHDATFAGTVALDQAVLDERDLDKALKAASVEVTKAWEILARYPPAHRATDSDLLALGRANRRQDPGCESCARTMSVAGSTSPCCCANGATSACAAGDVSRPVASWNVTTGATSCRGPMMCRSRRHEALGVRSTGRR